MYIFFITIPEIRHFVITVLKIHRFLGVLTRNYLISWRFQKFSILAMVPNACITEKFQFIDSGITNLSFFCDLLKVRYHFRQISLILSLIEVMSRVHRYPTTIAEVPSTLSDNLNFLIFLKIKASNSSFVKWMHYFSHRFAISKLLRHFLTFNSPFLVRQYLYSNCLFL